MWLRFTLVVFIQFCRSVNVPVIKTLDSNS
jgi:hypothetical protein